jgi:subtilisin family serine protease
MKRLVRPAVLLTVALLVAGIGLDRSASVAAAAQASSVIVVLRDGVDAQQAAAEHRARYGADVSYVYGAALRGYAARIPANALAAIARDPRVAFISEDNPVWATDETPTDETPTGVDRIVADKTTSSGHNNGGPAIAVIDTGSGPHGELNIFGGKNCSNGRPTNYSDGNGHGTHVAGTIAAKFDGTGTGVAGVLPGAPIYSVRVLNNQGSGSWSSVVCGIDWVTANAASNNIKVANMSLGGTGSDDGNCGNSNNDALHKAICGSVAAGVTYVVAAGNSATNLAGFVPAAYDEVLAVTAMSDSNGQPGGGNPPSCRTGEGDDVPATFSNFATTDLDKAHTIAAPGVCIYSTWKGGGYNTISGTSMASPHVAGTVALCIAVSGPCATLSPSEIITRLWSDAKVRSADSTLPYYGFDGDANSTVGGRYYGYLIYAGGY